MPELFFRAGEWWVRQEDGSEVPLASMGPDGAGLSQALQGFDQARGSGDSLQFRRASDGVWVFGAALSGSAAPPAGGEDPGPRPPDYLGPWPPRTPTKTETSFKGKVTTGGDIDWKEVRRGWADYEKQVGAAAKAKATEEQRTAGIFGSQEEADDDIARRGLTGHEAVFDPRSNGFVIQATKDSGIPPGTYENFEDAEAAAPPGFVPRQTTGGFWVLSPAPASPQERQLTVDQLIARELEAGNFQGAIALRNFQDHPTDMELFDRALQIAKSPGDFFALSDMLRSSPDQPLGEVPRSRVFDMFGLAGSSPLSPFFGRQGSGLRFLQNLEEQSSRESALAAAEGARARIGAAPSAPPTPPLGGLSAPRGTGDPGVSVEIGPDGQLITRPGQIPQPPTATGPSPGGLGITGAEREMREAQQRANDPLLAGLDAFVGSQKRDIAAREAATEEQARLDAHLRLVAETDLENAQGNLSQVSEQTLRVLGLSRPAALGSSSGPQFLADLAAGRSTDRGRALSDIPGISFPSEQSFRNLKPFERDILVADVESKGVRGEDFLAGLERSFGRTGSRGQVSGGTRTRTQRRRVGV